MFILKREKAASMAAILDGKRCPIIIGLKIIIDPFTACCLCLYASHDIHVACDANKTSLYMALQTTIANLTNPGGVQTKMNLTRSEADTQNANHTINIVVVWNSLHPFSLSIL